MKKISRRNILQYTFALSGAFILSPGRKGSCVYAASPQEALENRPESAARAFGAMSCAQALANSYADLVGLQSIQAKNLAAGFGLGMGRKHTCGAVTVMLMIAGLAGKGSLCPELMDSFEKEMGSIQCAYFTEKNGYGTCKDLLRFSGTLLNRRVFS